MKNSTELSEISMVKDENKIRSYFESRRLEICELVSIDNDELVMFDFDDGKEETNYHSQSDRVIV